MKEIVILLLLLLLVVIVTKSNFGLVCNNPSGKLPATYLINNREELLRNFIKNGNSV